MPHVHSFLTPQLCLAIPAREHMEATLYRRWKKKKDFQVSFNLGSHADHFDALCQNRLNETEKPPVSILNFPSCQWNFQLYFFEQYDLIKTMTKVQTSSAGCIWSGWSWWSGQVQQDQLWNEWCYLAFRFQSKGTQDCSQSRRQETPVSLGETQSLTWEGKRANKNVGR